MKLYDIKDSCVCSFSAQMSEQNISRMKRSLYYNGIYEKRRIDISEVTRENINAAIAKLNLLPTDIICNLDDCEFWKYEIPYSGKSGLDHADLRAKRYYEGYLIVKHLPILYHIFFDADGNINENVVENLIQYLQNELTFDFHIKYERKIELIKKFFALLEIELDSVLHADAFEEVIAEEIQVFMAKKEVIDRLKAMLNPKEEVVKKEII